MRRQEKGEGRLLTLDLDDTIWPVRETLVRAQQEMLKWVRARDARAAQALAPADFSESKNFRDIAVRENAELVHDVGALRKRIMEMQLLAASYTAVEASEMVDGAFAVFYAWRQRCEPFADFVPAMQEVRRRFSNITVGSLTNGNADVQAMPVWEHLDFSVSAHDTRAKPDVAQFQHALKQSGVSLERALHVGDSPTHDVQGARGAGFATIWFNPKGVTWELESPCPQHVRSWKEFPDVLSAIWEQED